MQHSGKPGRVEALSMEEYLNKRKKIKEKENKNRKQERITVTDPFFFFGRA